jgi:hypothetical protein
MEKYHFYQLVVTNAAGFVYVVEVEQDSGLLLEGTLDHDVYGGQKLIIADITLGAFVKQPEHLVTPQSIEVEKRVKMLAYDARFSSPASDVLEHDLEQL